MIGRRRVLVVEHRKEQLLSIRLALRRLDEWTAVRWVADAGEALEVLGEIGEACASELVLFGASASTEVTLAGLAALLHRLPRGTRVALLCDSTSCATRLRLQRACRGVPVLTHPLGPSALASLLLHDAASGEASDESALSGHPTRGSSARARHP